MFVFRKIFHDLISCYLRFQIRAFAFLLTIYPDGSNLLTLFLQSVMNITDKRYFMEGGKWNFSQTLSKAQRKKFFVAPLERVYLIHYNSNFYSDSIWLSCVGDRLQISLLILSNQMFVDNPLFLHQQIEFVRIIEVVKHFKKLCQVAYVK